MCYNMLYQGAHFKFEQKAICLKLKVYTLSFIKILQVCTLTIYILYSRYTTGCTPTIYNSFQNQQNLNQQPTTNTLYGGLMEQGVFKQFGVCTDTPMFCEEAVKFFSELILPGSRLAFYTTNMRGVIANTNKTYNAPYVFIFKQTNKSKQVDKFFFPLKYLKKTNEIISAMIKAQENKITFV